MELPILRYVDVVIGVAVIVLLACTVVTAVTQLILSCAFLRARNLRDGLTDLIAQIDPKILTTHARYIAQRLLRHPLVARDNTVFGQATWRLRARWRHWQAKLPLPALNPPDTIQREEVIMLLLEWAGREGALHAQDQLLSEQGNMSAAAGQGIAAAREALRTALRNTGIGDPSAVAAAIRKRMILNECEHPEQPAQLWRSQAITEVATTDFAGRIHVWFDNTMARATESYSFFAQIVSSVIALVIALSVQLDAINLIRRLGQDDALRASLVAEAEVQIKRQEDARKSDHPVQALDAEAQREQIATSLADLRDPKRGITPSYLAWQSVAQTKICAQWLPVGSRTAKLRIIAGADVRGFTAPVALTPALDELGNAIRQSGAPVTVYHRKQCLLLIAQNSDIEKIAIFEEGAANAMTDATVTALDWPGLGVRFPGVLLSWVLISLGAPFWYDLLKKLVGFRSILAQKDDQDRQVRNDSQTALTATPPAANPSPPPGDGTVQEGDDERGELEATGAEG